MPAMGGDRLSADGLRLAAFQTSECETLEFIGHSQQERGFRSARIRERLPSTALGFLKKLLFAGLHAIAPAATRKPYSGRFGSWE